MSADLRRAGRRLALWGAAALVGVGVVQAWPIREHVEDDLTNRSVEALADAGLTGLDVRFSGRDGVVSGETDEATIERAVSVVGDLRGVRVVRGERTEAAGEAAGQADPTTQPTSGTGTSQDATTTRTSTPRTTTTRTTAPATTADGGTAGGGTADGGTADGGTAGSGTAGGGTAGGGTPGSGATSASSTAGGAPATSTPGAPGPTTAPAPTPTPTPTQPPPAPAPPVDLMAGLPMITFANAKWEDRPEHAPTLQALAERILASDPNQRWLIRAHTDTIGPKPDNQWLSDMRAMEICEELVERGVPVERLLVEGVGEREPLVYPEVTSADRAANRRVEIVAAP